MSKRDWESAQKMQKRTCADEREGRSRVAERQGPTTRGEATTRQTGAAETSASTPAHWRTRLHNTASCRSCHATLPLEGRRRWTECNSSNTRTAPSAPSIQEQQSHLFPFGCHRYVASIISVASTKLATSKENGFRSSPSLFCTETVSNLPLRGQKCKKLKVFPRCCLLKRRRILIGGMSDAERPCEFPQCPQFPIARNVSAGWCKKDFRREYLCINSPLPFFAAAHFQIVPGK